MKLIPERLRRRSEPEPDGTMTLVDHLSELRYRLIVTISAIAVGAIFGWFLFDRVIDLLLNPYCDYWRTVPLRLRATPDCALFFSGALEPLLIKFKLVAFLGLFLALPVVLYQLWAFIVPGLTRRERKMAIPFVVSSVLLFALGALVAYWTLPKALNFLLGFAGQGFAPLLTGDRYLTFVMLVALSFGLAFEFPIVLIFLLLAGAVTTRQLRDWRRGAILGIAVFAADHHAELGPLHDARDDDPHGAVLRSRYHRGPSPEALGGSSMAIKGKSKGRSAKAVTPGPKPVYQPVKKPLLAKREFWLVILSILGVVVIVGLVAGFIAERNASAQDDLEQRMRATMSSFQGQVEPVLTTIGQANPPAGYTVFTDLQTAIGNLVAEKPGAPADSEALKQTATDAASSAKTALEALQQIDETALIRGKGFSEEFVLYVINAKANFVQAMTLYGEAAKLLELAADAQGPERAELAARTQAIANAATETFDRGYADYIQAQTKAGTFAPPAPGLPAPTGTS